MRACVQCGAENPVGVDTCRSCGAVQVGSPAAAAPLGPEQGAQANHSQSSPAGEGFIKAPLSGQSYEQAQPVATMVASQPFGGGAPSVEVIRSDRPEPSSQTIRRSEVLVLLGAVLLFIATFLPFYDSSYGPSTNAWTWFLLPLLVVGFGSGVLAGFFIALDRFTTVGDVAGKVGLSLNQLVGVLAVVSATQLTLSVISAPLHGAAQWLALIAAALLLVGGVFAKHIPALTVPVGTSAPGVYGAAPMSQGATAWAPAPAPAPAPASAPAQGTSPFWFSVSAPTLVHDRADGSVRGELQPGRWYLATVSFGTAVEVSAEEFGTAILHDLTVLQRA